MPSANVCANSLFQMPQLLLLLLPQSSSSSLSWSYVVTSNRDRQTNRLTGCLTDWLEAAGERTGRQEGGWGGGFRFSFIATEFRYCSRRPSKHHPPANELSTKTETPHQRLFNSLKGLCLFHLPGYRIQFKLEPKANFLSLSRVARYRGLGRDSKT